MGKRRSMKKTMKRKTMKRTGGGCKKANKSKKAKGGGKKMNAWAIHVKKVFAEMKKKDKNTKFGDALRAAAKTYKKK